MVAETKLTKKQKKALAFRSRKGKGKAVDAIQDDVPVGEDQDLAEAEAEDRPLEDKTEREAAPSSTARRAEPLVEDNKPTRKRKRAEDEDTTRGADEKQSKTKKKKTSDGKAADPDAPAAEEEGKKANKAAVKQRYILFVGNLKYNTTREAVQEHFSKCDPPPTSVRLMTPKPSPTAKPTTKSKGFAFIEFNSRNALQQALKLHQSVLDGRQINVELTAGGGGKSETRVQKLQERNRALHEERTKRLMKQKAAEGKPTVNVELERPQRFSATSGVGRAPSGKKTWTVGDGDGNVDEKDNSRKRGKKNKHPPRALGTGVNAIPVG
ncbi:hypothetical protein OBBRIDRAFT_788998 [Obba rivulosa]|uniref:RRM domain-containing protein n=1 Tax=Obba rivulosa TaxID=1052685 RepID=A0A8E2J517_9APHY|nr:hypothetical protein OBBRIDRAFT_788998 [Obba rivulosa]